MNFSEVREQYPQYSDLDDLALAQGLHKKYYQDLQFDEFAVKIGLDLADLSTKLPERGPEPRTPEFRALPDKPNLTERFSRFLGPGTSVVPGGSAEAIAQFESGRGPGAGKRDLEEIGAKPDLLERGLHDFASGAITTGSGLAGMLSRVGVDSAAQVKSALDSRAEDLLPSDPRFLDSLISAYGSSATFFIPGMGIAKGAQALAQVAPKVALWLGAGAAGGMEATVESGMVYDNLRQRGYSHEVAASRADKAFWSNAGLLTVTNRLGLFGDYGTRLVKGSLSAIMEGGQEGAQQIISNVAEGREDPFAGVGESALIGALVGGGIGALTPGQATDIPTPAPADPTAGIEPILASGSVKEAIQAAEAVVQPVQYDYGIDFTQPTPGILNRNIQPLELAPAEQPKTLLQIRMEEARARKAAQQPQAANVATPAIDSALSPAVTPATEEIAPERTTGAELPQPEPSIQSQEPPVEKSTRQKVALPANFKDERLTDPARRAYLADYLKSPQSYARLPQNVSMSEAGVTRALTKALGGKLLSGSEKRLTQYLLDDYEQAQHRTKLPQGLPDPRLKRMPYRGFLEQTAANLVEGGGITLIGGRFSPANQDVSVDKETPVTRTPSQNPAWYQSMMEVPDLSLSVKQVKSAIRKTLNGEKLGIREARVIQAMLNYAGEEMAGERESRSEVAASLREVRRERQAKPAGEAYFDAIQQELQDFRTASELPEEYKATAAERFEEEAYSPEFDAPTRSMYEILTEASQIDPVRAEEIAESGASDLEVTRNLLSFISESRGTTNAQPETAAVARSQGRPGEGTPGSQAGLRPEAAPAEEAALAPYTEADLAAREQAATARTEAERQATQKAEVDAQLPEFTLTGSDRPADQAAARGQQDLLSSSISPQRQAYNAALERANAASREYQAIVAKYRSREIGDEEFLAAQAKHEAAKKEFDAAEKEYKNYRTRKQPTAIPVAESIQAPATSEPGEGGVAPAQAGGGSDPIAAILKSDIPKADQIRLASEVRKGEITAEDVQQVLGEPEKITDLGDKIGGARKDTATKLGPRGAKPEETPPAWRKRYVVAQSMADIENTRGVALIRKGQWMITDTRTGKHLRGVDRRTAVYDTQEAAEQVLPLLAVAEKHSVSQRSDGRYSIWRKIGDKKRVRAVKEDFATHDEAMNYMAQNAEAILETKLSFGEEILPTPEKVYRTGEARRQGNVKGQDFMDTFGFRAVEFGNWNNQDERQEVMNHAYDALLDMAEIINVDPLALSLNGELSLAFGARGQGLTGAKAHYEGDYAVINLTKMRGAGSLAHEWFHSLDHYFARLDDPKLQEKETSSRGDQVYKDTRFASHGFRLMDPQSRKELRDAYGALIQTMFRKAQAYVEDTQKAEDFVGKARDELANRIKEIRDSGYSGLSKQMDVTYRKRNNKPATQEQLTRFDQLAEMLLSGEQAETELLPNEGGRSRFPTYRRSNAVMDEMAGIYKKVRGHNGFTADKTGVFDHLSGTVRLYRERIKMLQDAKAETEKTKSVPTSYYMQAKAADQARSGDYWSSEHEMAARAFAAYVEDKLSGKDNQNDFLAYHAHGAFLVPVYPEGFFRPYPEGAERVAVNQAFDKLFNTLEQKETDQGVALFSLSDNAIISASIKKAPVWADRVRLLLPEESPSQEPSNRIVTEQDIVKDREADYSMSDHPDNWSTISGGADDTRYKLSLAQVETAIAHARSKVSEKVGLKVNVIPSSEIPAPIKAKIPAGKVPKGFNYRGEVYLIHDALADAKDTQVTFAHEVKGHFGLERLLGPEDWQTVVEGFDQMLAAHERTPDARLQPLLEDLNRRYDGADHVTRVKEFISLAAEAQEREGPVGRFLDLVRRLFLKAMRALGFQRPFSVSDVHELLARSEAYLRTGEAETGMGEPVMQGQPLFAQGKQTDTPAFRKWFGNSVVTVDGKPGSEPLMVYHGTRSDFSEFDSTKGGGGFYFATGTEGQVNDYTLKGGGDGANIVPVYLNIRNPATVDQFLKEGAAVNERTAIKQLQQQGFDGVHYPKPGTEDGAVWIAFHSEQIKSATGNRGTFDPENPNILFSLEDRDPPYVKRMIEQEQQEAYRKAGLSVREVDTLGSKLRNISAQKVKSVAGQFADRTYEGLFDGLINILRAEETVGVTDPRKSGYIGARMSTSVSDLMTAVLKYGAPVWADGGIQYKEGTVGALEVFGELGEDLRTWLGWMAGHRAQELMAQGRERNFTKQDITELIGAAKGKEDKFENVRRKYLALNKAMLDFAETAGEIDPEARKRWESDWYVPFYRALEDESVLGPRTKRGLSHQSAGIKALKGGETPTNDLLENILTNWVKLADSAVKNMAELKIVDNLKGTPFLTNETLKYKQVVVPRSEIVKKIKGDRNYVEMLADMLGVPEAGEIEVLHEIAELSDSGWEKVWSMVAPSDPNVIRVMRGGKYEYYRVNDQGLLRSILSLGFNGFNDPVTKSMRWFKRLLTTGVTTSPDFMFRNFVRDAAHSWAINKDGFRFGRDSIAGLAAALKEDADYRALMFQMGSFQGGYVHGTDPEASAQILRRTLAAKGFTGEAVQNFENSILNTPDKLWNAVQRGWQTYRGFGDKIENSNRLAAYKAAIAAGKHPIQAAFEAKDVMDYNRRGNFQALMWFTDVVPFLNARLQGMEKLYRSAKHEGRLSRVFAIKFAKIAAFSVLLAMLNDDDDDYQALPDWEKDAYWHIYFGDEHFRIPKPFELGILAGTIPERMYRSWVTGSQPSEKLKWSLLHNLMQTMNFNPIPQIAVPAIEVWGNRSFYFDTPIEGMADKNKLPEARYNDRTTEIAKTFGQWLGVSPKKLEHLWEGYTGTMGAYILAASDMAARAIVGAPTRPIIRPGDVVGLKSFYRGSQPPYSTQYETDMYDALEEVDQIYSTSRDYIRQGLSDEAAVLRTTNKDKLKHRVALRRASDQIGNLRKRISVIQRSDKSRSDKRQEIDALLVKKAEITRRISEQVEGDF